MSRQFRFFLLPSDTERLVDELRSRFGARLISDVSPTLEPLEIVSPLRKIERNHSTDVHCYFMPSWGTEIKAFYIEKRQLWAVDEERSEIIEFSGCEYDGKILQPGRFYFHTDFLIKDAIWRKRPEFQSWADSVFRSTKRSLHWSKSLQLYIGKEAAQWRKMGGRFAWHVDKNGGVHLAEE